MAANIFKIGRKLVDTAKGFGKSLVPPPKPKQPYMQNKRQKEAFDRKAADVQAKREEAFTRQGITGTVGVGTVLALKGGDEPAPAKPAPSSPATRQSVPAPKETKAFIPWRERKAPSSSSASKTPKQKEATGISSSVTQRESVDMTPMERIKSTAGYKTRFGTKPRGKMAALERHRERTAAAKRKEPAMAAQQKRINAEMAKAKNKPVSNQRVSVSTPMGDLKKVNRTMSYLESFNGSKPSSAPPSPNPRTEINNNDPYGLKAQGEDIRKRYEARSKSLGY
jgi:hypothetical protein